MKILKMLMCLTLGVANWMASSLAFANPNGLTQLQGLDPTNPTVTNGNTLTINQVDARAILHWQQFNIAPNEVTRFVQPSAQSIALNRIFDTNPSQILGSLQANGSVILLNPNGVLFGPGAQVNVNGLIASSLNITDSDFLNGQYAFQGSPLDGSVQNAGTIETATGGFVYLLAPNVQNSGIIRSPEGHIALAAGATAYLSNRPDGRGFLVEITAPAGEALNLKELIADGGKINLFGRVVNQSGLIQANSIRERNGRIELIASEQVQIKNGSRTIARGGAEGVSSGGTVIALADKTAGATRFENGAEINVSGGEAGGDGGFVELSSYEVSLGGSVSGLAQPGFRGGRFLLDPPFIRFDDAEVFRTQVLQQIAMEEMTFQADHDIDLIGITFDFNELGLQEGERVLRFVAGDNLRFNSVFLSNGLDGSGIKWDIKGIAGNDIVFTETRLWLGKGGGFDFEAGRDIRLEVNPITSVTSSLWTLAGESLEQKSGDIRLKAGGDVIAPILFDPSIQGYGGIRLARLDNEFRLGEANQPTGYSGNLTIETGRDFLGGFVLANGTAEIVTGGNFGRSSSKDGSYPDFSYANLFLGKGTIEVESAGDIYLGRVTDFGFSENIGGYLDSENAVRLTAEGGDIHLNPQRDSRLDSLVGERIGKRTIYYPPTFVANAKQGNIFIQNGLTFWPSLTGTLDLSAGTDILGGLTSGGPLKISLWNVNPNALRGTDGLDEPTFDPLNIGFVVPENTPPASVRIRTQNGDISELYFLLKTGLPKQVEINAGQDLNRFVADIMIPQGTEAVVLAERDINMAFDVQNTGESVESGISFYGIGQGTVYAGRNLDLGNSKGIQQRQTFGIDRTAAGLIDISVGNNLLMTTSRIYTYAGASISIHGTNGSESAVGDGTNLPEGQVHGVVDVGTNDLGTSTEPDRGIATVGGGSIDILAKNDVNVNASRVATFGGGDIRITSIEGDINAGFGGANDIVTLAVPIKVIDSDGKLHDSQLLFRVPGSGIFTFHDSDPAPLPPYPPPPEPVLPPFEWTPEMRRLQMEMIKRSVLGQDISSLEAKFKVEADLLSKAYQVEVDKAVTAAALQYEQIKEEHRKDWKLGDIILRAKEGSVVVPPAGIRGRKITIEAKTLDLQGGQLSGDLQVDVGNITGGGAGIIGPVAGNIGSNVVTSISLPSIPTGGATGGVSLGGLSGSTGSISAASSGSVTTASAAVATVQEKVVEQARAEEPSASATETAETSSEEANEKRTEHGREKKAAGKFRSLQIRRGVVIQVEVNEEPP
jgi:filamentous hemagglutinin family protein